MSTSSKILAINLRYYRSELGLTQSEMAEKCGLSFRLYQDVESSRSNPTIETLTKLALGFLVTTDRLLRLDILRIPNDLADFLDKFKVQFQNAHYCVGIRDLDGVALWANPSLEELTRLKLDSPLDLMKVMRGEARDALRKQLECEKRFFVSPYLNTIKQEDNSTPIYVRYYPTLIVPLKGNRVHFSALYVSAIETDCHRNYFDFCENIIKCI